MPQRPLSPAVLVYLTVLDFLYLCIAWCAAYVAVLGFSIPSTAESDLAFQLMVLMPWVAVSGALMLTAARRWHFGLPKEAALFAQVLLPIVAATIGWGAFAGWVKNQPIFLQLPLNETAESVLPIPDGVIVLFGAFAILLVGLARGAAALTAPRGPEPGDEAPKPALLVGSGALATTLARDVASLAKPPYVFVSAVSSESERVGSSIAGVRLAGRLEMIPQLLGQTYTPAVVVIQDEHHPAVLREVVRRCEDYPVRILMVDPTASSAKDIRPVRLADLVSRRPLALHASPDRGPFKGERLLITSADTPLGAEMAWQASRGFPVALILQGQSEDALARIAVRIRREHPSLPVETVLVPVADAEAFDGAIRPLAPTAIVHALPLHRVEMAEKYPAHAISQIVLGAKNIAVLAKDLGFRRTVFLSSVKAVYPAGVLGACCRLVELIAWRLAREAEHSVQVVRMPTLVGSGFSALEIFEDLARSGDHLTVSHPDAVRLYLGLEEAVDRALQALSVHGGNGRLFLIDAGDAVKISELAKAAAVLAGKRPGKDLAIEYSGLGPGEKLREELAMFGEDLLPTEVGGVLMVQPREVSERGRLEEGLAVLPELIPHGSREELLGALRELVPEYHPSDLPEKGDAEMLAVDRAQARGQMSVSMAPRGKESREQVDDLEDLRSEETPLDDDFLGLSQKPSQGETKEGDGSGSPEVDDGRPLRIGRSPVVFMDLEEAESRSAEPMEIPEPDEAVTGDESLEIPESDYEQQALRLEPEVEALTPAAEGDEERAPDGGDAPKVVAQEQPFLFPDWLEELEQTPPKGEDSTPETTAPSSVPLIDEIAEVATPPLSEEDPMNEQFAELKKRGKLVVPPLEPLPVHADVVLLVFMEGLDIKRQREVLGRAEERFPDDVHFLFAGLLPEAAIPPALAERARGLDPSIAAGATLWNAALEASPDNALLVSFPPRVEFHGGFFGTLREFAATHKDSVLFYADHIDRKGSQEVVVKVHDHNGCPHERFEFGPVMIYRTSALKAIEGFDESLTHAWEYDAHLKLMMEGFFTRIPGPIYTANEEVVDTKSSALHSPGRGPLGGFSYVFYPEAMDREVTMVFERALKKVGAWIDHPSVPVPQPATKPPVMASVVVPVLNRVKFIGNAIEKVLEGTFHDFEMIIVDNGSTDGTYELVEEFTRRDPRVRLMRGTGSSIASALNDGIRAARGKYICQLDSDDQYAPTTLERMIGHLESHPNCGLAISYYRLMDEHGKVIEDVAPITHSGYSRNQILRRDGGGAVRIFPKAVLEEFGLYDEEHYGNFGEDYDMVLKTGEKYDVDRVHDVLYFYRRHSDNTDVIRDPEMKYHNKNRARQMALRRRMKINEDLGKL